MPTEHDDSPRRLFVVLFFALCLAAALAGAMGTASAAQGDQYDPGTTEPDASTVWVLNGTGGVAENFTVTADANITRNGTVVGSTDSDNTADVLSFAIGNLTAANDTVVVGDGEYNLTDSGTGAGLNLAGDPDGNLSKINATDGAGAVIINSTDPGLDNLTYVDNTAHNGPMTVQGLEFNTTGATAGGLNVSAVGSGFTLAVQQSEYTGGGIFADTDFAWLNVSRTTVSSSFADGIRLDGSSATLNVTDSTVTANARSGLALDSAGGAVVENATATENGVDGIELSATTASSVTASNASDNVDTGLDLSGSDNATVEDTEANANDNGHGIRLASSSDDATVRNVTTNDNGIEGVLVESTNDTLLEGSTATGNAAAGLNLTAAINNTVRDATADSNQDGIRLGADADNNTVRDSAASANANAGVALASAANNTVENVTADSNHDGIVLDTSEQNTVENSTARNNGGYGLLLDSATTGANDNDVLNSTAGDNANGIGLNASANNDISDLVVQGNDEQAVTIENGSTNNDFEGIDIGNSTAENTTLEFTGSDVRINATADPPANADADANAGRYFNATNVTADAFLNVSVAYDDADLPSDADESTVSVWNYDAAAGTWGALASTVDAANDTVRANATEFSRFGVFVDLEDTSDPSSSGSGSSSGSVSRADPTEIPFSQRTASQTRALGDDDADRPGFQLGFSRTRTVEEIGFSGEDLSTGGLVTVTESDRVPDTAAQPTRSVRSVMRITVPSSAADTPATIRFRLGADSIETDPESIALERYDPDAEAWSELPTRVVETDGDTVRFEADTPGFSLFAVTESDPASEDPAPDDSGSTDDGSVDDGADDGTDDESVDDDATDGGTDDGTADDGASSDGSTPEDQPGLGVVAAIAALTGTVALLRRLNHNR